MASKSVRFEASAKPASAAKTTSKRKRDGIEDKEPQSITKKKNRPNEDELDDIEEWENEDDDDETAVPSERERLEARRIRRLKAAHVEDGERTRIDDTTSLATEGITIEPFHMNQEETDGTGYFDGDTYVFRKRSRDEEPDAWLESLEAQDFQLASSKLTPKSSAPSEAKHSEASLDGWSKEQLYQKILPLVSDTETIKQAVRRYGELIKQQKGDLESYNLAKTCLNELTGAASALLLQGEVDIYETTRNDILKMIPAEPTGSLHSSNADGKKVSVLWEYMGNQDDQIHGPYTSEQMLAWTKMGYFVGSQQVKVRIIQEKKLSTKDELLNDLMEEGDDDKDANRMNGSGDWMSSIEVDFKTYLT